MRPKGRLIIIGGKEDKDNKGSEMKDENHDFEPNEILKLIADSKNDRIEVVTTATSEPKSTEKTYSKVFKELGYSNFGFLYITDGQKTEPDRMKRINEAKTIFFSGGDQCKICNILKDTDVAKLIYRKYLQEADFTVAGTSAGAMCMSYVMIGGAVNGEATLGHDVELDEGLSFLDCMIDTHFVHRGRFGRLSHAVVLHPKLLGLGLGEDTALIIENGNMATCKGSGMVIVINGREIKQTNVEKVEKGQPVFAENLIVDILTDGCSIDLTDAKMNVK